MSKLNTNSSNILSGENKSKNTSFTKQKAIVYNAFSEYPKTMLQVAIETNILRANICRYVDLWKKKDCIEVLKKGICPITKNRSGFYYTRKEASNE